MEFAAAALSTVASAVTTTATAIGSTVSSLFGSIGGMGTVASILSGGATIASALAAQRAGQEKALSLEFQAQDSETESRAEGVAGLERRNSLRKALIDQIAEQDTAYAATGVDLSFGTPVVARDQASADAERALNLDQESESFRRSRLTQRAGALRGMASAARRGGLAKAAGLVLDGGVSLARR